MMKQIRSLCAALWLSSMCALSTFAGEMPFGVAATPAPSAKGVITTGVGGEIPNNLNDRTEMSVAGHIPNDFAGGLEMQMALALSLWRCALLTP